MAQPVERGTGYTYDDYLTWNDGRRWEIIEGVAYEKVEGPTMVSDMSPGPSRYHQTIVTNLVREIGSYLKGKAGKLFTAPFDVRLLDPEKRNVVQPDLCIFCTEENLDEKGATGAPDWVIEILSPYTSVLDLNTKFFLYQKHFVKEYWVVDPVKKIVTSFILENGNYGKGEQYDDQQEMSPSIFTDLKIDLRQIFAK